MRVRLLGLNSGLRTLALALLPYRAGLAVERLSSRVERRLARA